MKKGRPTFLFIAGVIWLFCAVDSSGEKPQWKGKVEFENGVKVLRNPSKPMYKGRVFNLVEELSIGTGRVGEEYIFSRISGIAVDSAGHIYVLDIKEAQIKVFDKEGNYIRTLGKKGQGPGEMVSPFSICITGKDEIFVQDLNTHRIILFSLEGALLRTISTAELLLIGSIMDSRENIVGLVGISGPDRQVFKVMKFDSDLKPLFDFCSASRPSSLARPPYQPFNPEPAWALTREDAVIFGYTEDHELKLFDAKGKLVMKITKDYEPVKITRDEIEDRRKTMPGPMASEFAKYHTAYQDFSADEEGHIFVRTWEKPDDRRGYYFDVFDAEGRFMTRAIIPGRPLTWKKGHVYTLEEDPEGYLVVRRYKVFWKYPGGITDRLQSPILR